jgi:hypothetical protein
MGRHLAVRDARSASSPSCVGFIDRRIDVRGMPVLADYSFARFFKLPAAQRDSLKNTILGGKRGAELAVRAQRAYNANKERRVPQLERN